MISDKTLPTHIARHQRQRTYIWKRGSCLEKCGIYREKTGRQVSGEKRDAQGWRAVPEVMKQVKTSTKQKTQSQIKCLTHYITLSHSPRHKRYMQLFKRYF